MLEAMATGCIVVARRRCLVSTVVRDSRMDIWSTQRFRGLASKLKLILGERFEWAAIRENAVDTIRTKFEIKEYMVRLRAIYSKTIGK